MGLRNSMRRNVLIHLQGDNHGTIKRKHSTKYFNAKHATDTAHATAKAGNALYSA